MFRASIISYYNEPEIIYEITMLVISIIVTIVVRIRSLNGY